MRDLHAAARRQSLRKHPPARDSMSLSKVWERVRSKSRECIICLFRAADVK